MTMWCGPNDGGIKRSDRADTGHEQARPTDGVTCEGSMVWGGEHGEQGEPTADPSSLGAQDRVSSGGSVDVDETFSRPDDEPTSGAEIDDLTVLPAGNGTLGLTNIGNKPPEDEIADTGPTRTNEEMEPAVNRRR